MFTESINYVTIRASAVNIASISCGASVSFRFSHLQQVTVSDISFADCSMNLMNVTNATFVRYSFIDVAGYRCCAVLEFIGPRNSVQIEECTFLKNFTVSNNNRALLQLTYVLELYPSLTAP